uniref:Uncharacterized protein n=1 Tax=Rhabditophanes sp. KR3021 TaxID=114890 RepID=A0AC35TYC0_9BILA
MKFFSNWLICLLVLILVLDVALAAKKETGGKNKSVKKGKEGKVEKAKEPKVKAEKVKVEKVKAEKVKVEKVKGKKAKKAEKVVEEEVVAPEEPVEEVVEEVAHPEPVVTPTIQEKVAAHRAQKAAKTPTAYETCKAECRKKRDEVTTVEYINSLQQELAQAEAYLKAQPTPAPVEATPAHSEL